MLEFNDVKDTIHLRGQSPISCGSTFESKTQSSESMIMQTEKSYRW